MQGSASGQKKMIHPLDCWNPPATSSHARKCVRAKKQFAPLTAGTHQLHLRTQGSASGQKNNSPPLLLGPTSYIFARKGSASGQKKTIRPSDCWDPPAIFSHARNGLTVGTHLVEAYVALSFWSRTCTYILVDVEAHTCRSRGAHVASTRTYSGQGARK